MLPPTCWRIDWPARAVSGFGVPGIAFVSANLYHHLTRAPHGAPGGIEGSTVPTMTGQGTSAASAELPVGLCECGCGESVPEGVRFVRGHPARLASMVTEALAAGTPVTRYGVDVDPLSLIRAGEVKLTPMNYARLDREALPASARKVVEAAQAANALTQRPRARRRTVGHDGTGPSEPEIEEPTVRIGSTCDDERLSILARMITAEVDALDRQTSDPTWSIPAKRWHAGYVAGKRATLDVLRSVLADE